MEGTTNRQVEDRLCSTFHNNPNPCHSEDRSCLYFNSGMQILSILFRLQPAPTLLKFPSLQP